ncbi:hypothetical protein [Thermoleptolyngbya sp. M55_K2018_002]|uniref:hypothetical protein n=1 Tax=Thermoleptolyngbya sp. M55_K2018_002 TaxID=2747808 RepID=UPI001A0FDFF3|nr:hypothetical protein [Thermoleptolyngbya sp. M55_K2018_002]HIK42146.1 hypothetical protein [Thermoleptolyngbya sp. M55_K2018_002]
MVDIVDTPSGFVPVTRIETSDLALGGNEVNSPNKQLKELARRDRWLNDQLAAFIGVGDTVAQNSFEAFKQAGIAGLAQGRLTLVSGNPTGTAAGATVLYYTPYNGDVVSLYNTTLSRWEAFTFTERSLSLAGLLANTNYDIFLFDNAGTLTLQAVAWTNGTTRAVALVRQNGVLVKNSDLRRYLGTIRINPTAGQCTDDNTRRFVYNELNQEPRPLSANVSASYTYASTTYRAVNNNTTVGQGRVEIVTGRTIDGLVSAILNVAAGAPTGGIAVVLDANAPGTGLVPGVVGLYSINTIGQGFIPSGYHFIQMSEAAFGGTASLSNPGLRIDLRM